jgi:SAM-dependent methyltransferase
VDSPNVNVQRWQTGNYVSEYANRTLRPAEVVLLARYREALSGRVLEVGCGAGRLLGYLVALGGDVHGIDVSPRMVEYCRRRYPEASVMVGDMSDLPQAVGGGFDAIFASFNVIDVLEDPARREFLADMHRRLEPGGLLIFSSHNLAFADAGGTGPSFRRILGRLNRPPRELLELPLRLRTRMRNRRRMAALERREGDHAMLNDLALDYALLHYYIRRDDQERQLGQLDYQLVECLDLDGRTVDADEQASYCSELHYVARKPRPA